MEPIIRAIERGDTVRELGEVLWSAAGFDEVTVKPGSQIIG